MVVVSERLVLCVCPRETSKMFLLSGILRTFEWTPFFSNPVECSLQGLVGACGVSVLCNLARVYYFVQTCNASEAESKERSSSAGSARTPTWTTTLRFWVLCVLLSLLGQRVCSLIVLEFTVRSVSAWTSAGLESRGGNTDILLIQCQFSLGCGLVCLLAFLHQGAPHSWACLCLAAGLSWALAGLSHSLWSHVAKLYPLHSTERYCGKCITLLTSGHNVLASLHRVVILAFALATVAAAATVYGQFLVQKDALKFWIPLTLCYTAVVVYSPEDQHQQSGTDTLLQTAFQRLGALLVLMLTVGDWSDFFQVFITFLGEAVCLLPSQDLLEAVLEDNTDIALSHEQSSRHTRMKRTRHSS
ncbi:transmembrane protein 82-like [Betta splendens]|uniref:Transmembrane protein 82-like n=1 Tax=Betta splendens TaxID=158456 RepID=A0A6P7MLD6_BETSP|nr:transmembrane protein 82-like [Betta splendens]